MTGTDNIALGYLAGSSNTIDKNGAVGIGTTTPSYLPNSIFAAVASSSVNAGSSNNIAMFVNSASSTGADVLTLHISETQNPSSANNYIEFNFGTNSISGATNNSVAGAIQGNGIGGIELETAT
jgi:hypothetical protein